MVQHRESPKQRYVCIPSVISGFSTGIISKAHILGLVECAIFTCSETADRGTHFFSPKDDKAEYPIGVFPVTSRFLDRGNYGP